MSQGVLRVVFAGGALALAAFAAACGSVAAEPHLSGATLYGSCVSCHGAHAEGNQLIGAPRIAGMPQWYVAAQLTDFQTGLRGQHPDDTEGLRMRAMSKQMMSADEVQAVAGYIASLPKITNPATMAGANLAQGQAAFMLCTACHGPDGHGNEQVKAPPLAGQDDWYVARQVRKFRSGIRGKAPRDTVGPIMQATSMAIDPANIEALAAYVRTLPR
jgi:cytochrome c oxidase subunit II